MRLRLWLGFVAALLLAAMARGQHVVYAERHGQFHLVHAARGGDPLVLQDGKLVVAGGARIAMKTAPEFAPDYVTVRDVEAHTEVYSAVMGGNAGHQYEFHLTGEFEAVVPLERVFVVLDMTLEKTGHTYLIWEVDDLKPGRPKSIALHAPMEMEVGAGHYFLHVFVDGVEALCSMLPDREISAALDRMVAQRTKAIAHEDPQPFLGPVPFYPDKLLGRHLSGQATVHFIVTPSGRVTDPKVTSATDAAFGEAAVLTIRQWRFLPRIVNGEAVSSAVTMPLTFEPR